MFRRSTSAFSAFHRLVCKRLCATQTSTAHVFHPEIQTLEADIQSYYLTKTLRVGRRPQVVTDARESVDLPYFKDLVDKSVVFAKCYVNKEEKKTPATYPYGLLQNILKTVLTSAHRYPHLSNLTVGFEPYVTATWTCEEKNVAVRGRPGNVLTSKQPLPQFYDDAIVEESKSQLYGLPDIYSLYGDLPEYQVHKENCTGFRKNRFFRNFHTLFVVDIDHIPEIQVIQRGLFYTFGLLLTHAVEKHGEGVLGNVLPKPECGQCVVTNGKRFSFIWFQLNTLDIASLSNGVKNLVHIERPGWMYSAIDTDSEGVRELQEYNEEVLRTLLSVFMLH